MIGGLRDLNQAALQFSAAGAAITGSLLASAHAAAQVGDEVAKASDKTGVAIDSLSRLRYAAEQSAVAFPQLEAALFRQARAANEAATGVGRQAEVYRALGVDVRDVNGSLKDGETLMIETAEALRQLDNDTQRTAFAMEIFGRSGAQLLPLFKDGAAGIEELTARAKELGLEWSEGTARDAERFNDALSDVKLATTGLGQSIGAVLFPIVAELVERTAELIGAYRRWADAHPGLNRVLVMVTASLGALLSTVGGALLVIPRLVAGWTTVATALKAVSIANIQARAATIATTIANAPAAASAWAAAGGFTALAASLGAAARAAWPVMLTLLGITAVIVDAIGRLALFADAWKAFQEGDYAAAGKVAAQAMLPGLGAVRGFEVIGEFADKIKNAIASGTEDIAAASEAAVGGMADEILAAGEQVADGLQQPVDELQKAIDLQEILIQRMHEEGAATADILAAEKRLYDLRSQQAQQTSDEVAQKRAELDYLRAYNQEQAKVGAAAEQRQREDEQAARDLQQAQEQQARETQQRQREERANILEGLRLQRQYAEAQGASAEQLAAMDIGIAQARSQLEPHPLAGARAQVGIAQVLAGLRDRGQQAVTGMAQWGSLGGWGGPSPLVPGVVTGAMPALAGAGAGGGMRVLHEVRLGSDGETTRILTSNPEFREAVGRVVREIGGGR